MQSNSTPPRENARSPSSCSFHRTQTTPFDPHVQRKITVPSKISDVLPHPWSRSPRLFHSSRVSPGSKRKADCFGASDADTLMIQVGQYGCRIRRRGCMWGGESARLCAEEEGGGRERGFSQMFERLVWTKRMLLKVRLRSVSSSN